jgi:hypothetical protein
MGLDDSQEDMQDGADGPGFALQKVAQTRGVPILPRCARAALVQGGRFPSPLPPFPLQGPAP